MLPFSTPMCAGGLVQSLLWNPADKSPNVTLSNGDHSAAANGSGAVRASIGRSTGKWYFEVSVEAPPSSGQALGIGLCGPSSPITGVPGAGADPNSWGYASYNGGPIYSNGAIAAGPYGTYGVGDTISVAFWVAGSVFIWFAKNGVWLNGDPAAGTGGIVAPNGAIAYYPVVGWLGGNPAGAATARGNVAHTPPAGFSLYS